MILEDTENKFTPEYLKKVAQKDMLDNLLKRIEYIESE